MYALLEYSIYIAIINYGLQLPEQFTYLNSLIISLDMHITVWITEGPLYTA